MLIKQYIEHIRANHPIILKIFKMLQAPSPTYLKTDKTHYLKLRSILESEFTNPRILNIGSGPEIHKRNYYLGEEYVSNMVHFDIVPYPVIDFQADAHYLPLVDECFDLLLFHSEIEHMHTPPLVVDEMYRVLKPGGIAYAVAPFILRWHPKGDYYRFSEEGIHHLFKRFEKIEDGIIGGPASALSCILRYFLPLIFSFGTVVLYWILVTIFGWLTFWIKYLDFFLVKHPCSPIVSLGFYSIYRRP